MTQAIQAFSPSRKTPGAGPRNTFQFFPMPIHFLPKHPSSSSSSRRAFSLIELLAVVSLILLMTGLSVVTWNGHNSIKMTDSTLQLTGLFEQGRQYALGQKTYVWVMFHEPADAKDTLLMALFASNDGTNSVPWSADAPIEVSSANLIPISKVFKFESIKLLDAGIFTHAEIPALVSEPVANTVIHSLPNKKPAFAIPRDSQTIVFNRVFQITPSGQIRTGTSPIDFVELEIQAVRGELPDPDNVASIRLNGLTGVSRVYRK